MKRGIHAAAWVALFVAAFVLWPQRWGGSMTYVITSGVSMQPGFHQGDLAILRSAGDYRVGDVAAYHSPELKRIVMHRISKETPTGYAFKGDNNKFLDPGTVTEKQMLGKLVLRVPKVGLGAAFLLKPINLILAVGALFLLLADRKERPVAPPVQPGVVAAPVYAPAPTIPVPTPSVAPVIVRITAMRLPQDLPTADVGFVEDLEQLARTYSLAILRDEEADYVLQGGMVFRHLRADATFGQHEANEPVSPGRDWFYPPAAHPDVIDLSSRRRHG